VNPRAAASTGKQQDLSQPLLLFPSSPAVTTTVTCKRRKKRKQSFGSSSPFLDLLSFCFLSSSRSDFFVFSLPQVADQAAVSRLELR
jgi:hypothetical protein